MASELSDRARARLSSYAVDPVAFIDDMIKLNENGDPFELFPYQRAIQRMLFAFRPSAQVGRVGRMVLDYNTIIYSAPKKSGKSFHNALDVLWWAYTQEPPNEIHVVANDYEQAQQRVFSTVGELIERNELLRRSLVERTKAAIVLSNGTVIRPVAQEYKSVAGSNHGMTSWDELWAYTSERARRHWEELTPVPTRRNSVRLVSTYAGFRDESDVLWGLYELVMPPDLLPTGRGERLVVPGFPSLPVYHNRKAKIIAYWDEEPRLPWQTEEYYAEQRATLRPTTYARLHRNRWSSSEEQFIQEEDYDACVDPALVEARPSVATRIFIGVDAGIKHDYAAVVAVRWGSTGRLELARHRCWRPSPEDPLDIGATIKAFIEELNRSYTLVHGYFDPYQLHQATTELMGAGVSIEELRQTEANECRYSQCLWEMIHSRTLRFYKAPVLREHVLNASARETAKGYRIVKEKDTKKIDLAVALSMACLSAMDKVDLVPSTAGPSRVISVHPGNRRHPQKFRDPRRELP